MRGWRDHRLEIGELAGAIDAAERQLARLEERIGRRESRMLTPNQAKWVWSSTALAFLAGLTWGLCSAYWWAP